MQLACLETLVDAGLKSLVLVGDFDQSIFGFTGASPDLCKQLAGKANLSDFRLTKNFRSSQKICNLSANFRQRPTPDEAVGADANCDIAPRLITYSPLDPSQLQTKFSAMLEELGEDVHDTVIVTRNNELGTAIRGYAKAQVPGWAKPLIEAARIAPSLNFEVVRAVELLVLNAAEEVPPGDVLLDSERLRDEVLNPIESLPPLTGDMIEWLVTGQELASEAVQRLAPSELGPGFPPISAHFSGQDAAIYSSDAGSGRHPVDSVHAVKGRGVAAVMLVAGTSSNNYFPDPAEQWAAMLRGESALTEELRIVYVALTRARRLLVMAVPETTSAAAIETFEAAGFQTADR